MELSSLLPFGAVSSRARQRSASNEPALACVSDARAVPKNERGARYSTIGSTRVRCPGRGRLTQERADPSRMATLHRHDLRRLSHRGGCELGSLAVIRRYPKVLELVRRVSEPARIGRRVRKVKRRCCAGSRAERLVEKCNVRALVRSHNLRKLEQVTPQRPRASASA